ncbi:MAG: GAF domain-containing protein [Chloroflexi bacterium]|nr:GAF domain-containing protein [Chloroflexota bacterium]
MLPDFRERHEEFLQRLMQDMLQELDLSALLRRLLRFAVTILAGRAGVVALRDPQRGWRLVAAYGLPAHVVRTLDDLVQDVPLHQDPLTWEYPEIRRRLEWLTFVGSLNLEQGVGLPLLTQDQLLGVLFVYRNYPAHFTRDDLARLQLFANQAAIAVRNAWLYTQLRHEKQRLDALLDAVADGLLILTPDLTLARLNQTFAQMYGANPEDLKGLPHHQVVRWARLERGTPLEQARAEGWPAAPHDVLDVQGDLERPGQRPLPVHIRYSPLFADDGDTLLNIIASVRDMTAFREAEKLKSTFISTISHELKTPIALIKGYVSTLRRPDVRWDSDTVQESLAIIEEEADRLARLVQDLLEASRLQSGGVTLHRSPVDLPALVRRVVQRFTAQAQGHTFRLNFPEDFPRVLADEGRLEQVLSNLVANALKYAPPETEICIRGEVRPHEVVVCVRDQGPGIPPEDQPYVFDPFYRSRATASKVPGTGLGLFLSRAIVEAHGGRMWVNPHYREGAEVCLALPRDEDAPRAPQGTGRAAK